MKKFNLDEYNRLKAEGKEPKIVTRNGYEARIISTDIGNDDYPILSTIKILEGCEIATQTTINGGYFSSGIEHPYDLFFADTEPTYRPYNDAEECFKDTLKHGGWIISGGDQYRFITGIGYRANHNIVKFNGSNWMTFRELMEAVWADDRGVCGKLIDE